jgi:hypothetical protein
MGIRDTFNFDEDEYRYEHKNCSSTDLVKKHHEKTRSISAATVSTGVGVLGAAASGGVSLALSGFALRQIDVLSQQAAILEEILVSRGEDVPRLRKRDIVGGLAVGSVSAAIGAATAPGLDHVANSVGQAASHAVNTVEQAAAHAATHAATHTADTVEQAATHAANHIFHAVNTIEHAATHAAIHTADTVEQAATHAANHIFHAVNTIEQTATHAATHTADTVEQAATHTATQATNHIFHAVNTIEQTATRATNRAFDAANDVVSSTILPPTPQAMVSLLLFSRTRCCRPNPEPDARDTSPYWPSNTDHLYQPCVRAKLPTRRP